MTFFSLKSCEGEIINSQQQISLFITLHLTPVVGRGSLLDFGLDGNVQPEPRNPYPFLRVILTKKGTLF